MLRVLTPEQALTRKKEGYKKLVSGKLFDLGRERYFIAVEKLGDAVKMIELDAENIRRILYNEPCVHSTLYFDEMRCLNVKS